MALGRPLSPLALSPSEKQQLLDWTRRPKTAQALALRARIVLLSAAGPATPRWPAGCMFHWPRWASGASVLFFSASTGCSMNPVLARRAA